MAEPESRTFPETEWGLEIWQVGVVRLPLWLPRADGRRLRALRVACFNDNEERVLASEVGTEAELPDLVEKVLAAASRSWTLPPDRVQVAETKLGELMEPLLARHGARLERVAELPAGLRRAQDLFLNQLTREDSRPSPLTGEGVTLARLAAFARAAAAFYASPVWFHLGSADRIRIEAPEAGEDLRELYVDSGFGPRKTLPGLSFLLEDSEDEALGWLVTLEAAWDAPPDDLDLWERYGLPWVGRDELCPVAWFESDFPERPDRRQLAFFEGLLNALAGTGEEELDSGRWEKLAETADGPVRFVLSLPDLLEPPPPEVEGQTPRERAEELVWEARLCSGRRGMALARRALEVWPGCAEACLFLSERSPSLDGALQILTRGAEAVQRERDGEAGARGPADLPLLLLRNRLADTLGLLGRFEEAAAAYAEILDLEPADPLAARYGFVNVLIALGRDAEARELADRFRDESSSLLAWPRALLSFRAEGDSPTAQRWLKRALQANRLTGGALLEPAAPSGDAPRAGQWAEAALPSSLAAVTWHSTPGALDWLRARTAPPPPANRGKARPGGKGKRRRR